MATPPILPGPAFSTPQGGNVSTDPNIAILQQMMQQQQNTQGTTQMGPTVPNVQVPQPTGQPRLPTNNAPQPVGPGQGGAVRRADRQNAIATITNTINDISTKLEQRKARQQQQVFDQFAQAHAGMVQAQGQVQQAQQQLQQAANALKQNPQDETARNQYAQAGQQLQQAKAALQQNATILNDIANDPKKVKLLSKGYGIDDKNASSPERQQAIASIKKVMPGLNDQSAGILSRLPQTQQLSPDAQAQQLARQAGVIGKAPTGNAELQAATNAAKLAQNFQIKSVDQFQKQEAIANKAGQDTSKMVAALPTIGMMPVQDSDGSYARNPDGSLKLRTMTAADVAGNPVLSQKLQDEKSKAALADAQAQATQVRARVAMMAEQRKQTDKVQANDPGTVANWGRLVTDPSSGQTLKDVPMAARSAVVKWAADNGKVISKPLTQTELNREDLARNAISNIDAAKAVVARRPDLFGPAGWGKTKFQLAFEGGDPDAVDFQANIKLANLPAIGIHGLKGKYAVEDLGSLDSNVYLNTDSMNNILNEIDRSAGEFKDMGGRRPEATSPQMSGNAPIVVSPEDMK
jgi:hypothetical protein